MQYLLLLQRLIQTEADLMRLEEVHSALLIEHKNLQGDYGTLHGYVEASKLKNIFSNYLTLSEIK